MTCVPNPESTRPRYRLVVVVVSVVAAVVGPVGLATGVGLGRDHPGRDRDVARPEPSRLGGGRAGRALGGPPTPIPAFAPGRSCASTMLPAPSSTESPSADAPRTSRTWATRLLASLEYNGSGGSGPSLIVALDWRTARVLARSEFPTLVGPLAESGKDLWALQVRPAALLRLDPLTLEPGGSDPAAHQDGRWDSRPPAARLDNRARLRGGVADRPGDTCRQPRPRRRLPGRSRRCGGERVVRRS